MMLCRWDNVKWVGVYTIGCSERGKVYIEKTPVLIKKPIYEPIRNLKIG